MPTREAVKWFKRQFNRSMERAVRETIFSTDMLTAIACQETGYIWNTLRTKNLPLNRLLELCVGDTIDASRGRKAFPKTKAELLSVPRGQEMFNLARQSLIEMSQYIHGYSQAAANPDKFCHGFGIFQLDLQFFRTDPEYFLQKQYTDFDICANRCVEELKHALRRICWHNKESLTDEEMACVGIAYNTGTYKEEKKLRQGFKDSSGKFYGEQLYDYIRLAKSVTAEGEDLQQPGTAFIAPPTIVKPSGIPYEINVISDSLRLRSEPFIDEEKPRSNVLVNLPDGHIVYAVSDKKVKGFLEVETNLNGAYFRGYASSKYLKEFNEVIILHQQRTESRTTIPPVYFFPKNGGIVRRKSAANASSLNEANLPGRKGTTAAELREEIAGIINWLAVENPEHLRYQPHRGCTFCNVYAHDYCYLSGVFLPRVWWTTRAILELARGEMLQPKYDSNIREMRANDLFYWFREFGADFGWRQTGTLNKLQTEVNQGAVGVIIAKRREEDKSGHIAAVVPETENHKAKRNSTGNIIAPLQSQAGISNFRYGGTAGWWNSEKFSDSAFWIHS